MMRTKQMELLAKECEETARQLPPGSRQRKELKQRAAQLRAEIAWRKRRRRRIIVVCQQNGERTFLRKYRKNGAWVWTPQLEQAKLFRDRKVPWILATRYAVELRGEATVQSVKEATS